MTASSNTRAVAALIKIMNSKNTLLRRRIEACEALLNYEAPEETVEKTKSFLTAVFEDTEHVGIDDRLLALKLMRKASAPRVTQQTVRSADADKNRETWRDLEIAARRMRLDKAGLWGMVTPDWADDLLAADYTPPQDRSIADLFED